MTGSSCRFCEQMHGGAEVCQAEQQVYSEIVDDLYTNDPNFRAEWDRWFPVDSSEGQRILRVVG